MTVLQMQSILCNRCSKMILSKTNKSPWKNHVAGVKDGSATERRKVFIQNWNEIWKTNPTPFFHYSKIHKYIVSHHSKLFKKNETGRIFLPLCGKTLDMIWLADKGHEVVGMDCSDIGIKLFYNENNLSFQKSSVGKHFDLYKCLSHNISIYCGDFLKSNSTLLGKFDAVWDRGSYTAVNMEQRKEYCAVIRNLLKADGKYLLSSTNYDNSSFIGPPHYVDEEDINKHFRPFYSVELLENESVNSPVYGVAQDQLRIMKFIINSKL